MSGRSGAKTRGRGRPTPGERAARALGAARRTRQRRGPEPRAGTVRHRRLFTLTHSQEYLGPSAGTAATSKMGRDGSAPSSSTTSLRPKTALRISFCGSSPADHATPQGKVPLLPHRISQSTNGKEDPSYQQSLGFPTHEPQAPRLLSIPRQQAFPDASCFPKAGARGRPKSQPLRRSCLNL